MSLDVAVPNVEPSELGFWWAHEHPDSYVVRWVDDDRCRPATHAEYVERECRRPHCHGDPVMAMLRGYGDGARWWLYCREHLYGRRIEDGIVQSPRLVHKDEL